MIVQRCSTPQSLLRASGLATCWKQRADSKSEGIRPFTVVMAGSGELELELRAVLCRSWARQRRIHRVSSISPNCPRLYGAVDIFVLPSENEPLGLGVNEAMCASLPVVVSREVGCVPDLVGDGVNGFTPAAGDVTGLSRALRRLIETKTSVSVKGKLASRASSLWGYRECLRVFAPHWQA